MEHACILMGDSIMKFGYHFLINHQTGEVHCEGKLVDKVKYGHMPTGEDYSKWIEEVNK